MAPGITVEAWSQLFGTGSVVVGFLIWMFMTVRSERRAARTERVDPPTPDAPPGAPGLAPDAAVLWEKLASAMENRILRQGERISEQEEMIRKQSRVLSDQGDTLKEQGEALRAALGRLSGVERTQTVAFDYIDRLHEWITKSVAIIRAAGVQVVLPPIPRTPEEIAGRTRLPDDE